MPRPDIKYRVWMDFETTGLDLANDEIVEGAVYVTDTDNVLVEHEGQKCRFDSVIQPSAQGLQRIYANDWVFKTHTANGLLNILENNQGIGAMTFFMELERMLMALGAEEQQYQLCGSGVERFDRHLMLRYWPPFQDIFYYRCRDVSNVREWLEGSALGWMVAPSTIDTSSHRAMPDVLRSVDEDNRLNDWITAAATMQKRYRNPDEGDKS